nr:MAG TPA: DNA-directed RNA polymerase [Caudoviricetes sp.]
MSKWKCDICGQGFDNFHAQGFEGKIYCPLCFFKKENEQLKSIIKAIKNYCNDIKKSYLKSDMCEYCDGKDVVSRKILEILKGDSND